MGKHSLGGRKPLREGKKTRRSLTITDVCCDGLELIAMELGLPSRSEVIEDLVRKELKKISRKRKKEMSLFDYILCDI